MFGDPQYIGEGNHALLYLAVLVIGTAAGYAVGYLTAT